MFIENWQENSIAGKITQITNHTAVTEAQLTSTNMVQNLHTSMSLSVILSIKMTLNILLYMLVSVLVHQRHVRIVYWIGKLRERK